MASGSGAQLEPNAPHQAGIATNVHTLMELYPEYDEATVLKVLGACEGDLHEAAEAFLYRRQAMKLAGEWVERKNGTNVQSRTKPQSRNRRKSACLTVFVSGMPWGTPVNDLKRSLREMFEDLQPPCTVLDVRIPISSEHGSMDNRHHRGFGYVDISATAQGMQAASDLALKANAGGVHCNGRAVRMNVEQPNKTQPPHAQDGSHLSGPPEQDCTQAFRRRVHGGRGDNSLPAVDVGSRFTNPHLNAAAAASGVDAGQSAPAGSDAAVSMDAEMEEGELLLAIERFRAQKEEQRKQLARTEEQERQLALRCACARKERVVKAVNGAEATLQDLLSRSNGDADGLLAERKTRIRSVFSSLRKQLDHREQVLLKSVDHARAMSAGSLFAAKQAAVSLLNPKVLNGLAQLDADTLDKMMGDLRTHIRGLADKIANESRDARSDSGVTFAHQEQIHHALSGFGEVHVPGAPEEDKLLKAVSQLTSQVFEAGQVLDVGEGGAAEPMDMRSSSASVSSISDQFRMSDLGMCDHPPGLMDAKAEEADVPAQQQQDRIRSYLCWSSRLKVSIKDEE